MDDDDNPFSIHSFLKHGAIKEAPAVTPTSASSSRSAGRHPSEVEEDDDDNPFSFFKMNKQPAKAAPVPTPLADEPLRPRTQSKATGGSTPTVSLPAFQPNPTPAPPPQGQPQPVATQAGMRQPKKVASESDDSDEDPRKGRAPLSGGTQRAATGTVLPPVVPSEAPKPRMDLPPVGNAPMNDPLVNTLKQQLAETSRTLEMTRTRAAKAEADAAKAQARVAELEAQVQHSGSPSTSFTPTAGGSESTTVQELRAEIERLKKREQENDRVLSEYMERIEQKVQAANKRAAAAEAVSQDMQRKMAARDNLLREVHAQGNFASTQLLKVAENAEKGMRQMFAGLQDLRDAAGVLAAMDRITRIEEDAAAAGKSKER